MALYHLSLKAFRRSAGRSSTAAAAYRAGEKIVDERTGEVHDYTRKQGVESAELVLPGGGTEDRAQFWNRVELHHKRGDAVVAREVEVALPAELDAEQRRALAVGFARELADRYGIAADVAIHAPSKSGDERNHHAHLLLSPCAVDAEGRLGKKVVELDPIHCQRHHLENVAERERGRWAELTNAALERHGHPARVDHRTLEAQGLDRAPTQHLGPSAVGFERRTQQKSRRRQDVEQEAQAQEQARAQAEKERAARGPQEARRESPVLPAHLEERKQQLRELARRRAAELEQERRQEKGAERETPRQPSREKERPTTPEAETPRPPELLPTQTPPRPASLEERKEQLREMARRRAAELEAEKKPARETGGERSRALSPEREGAPKDPLAAEVARLKREAMERREREAQAKEKAEREVQREGRLVALREAKVPLPFQTAVHLYQYEAQAYLAKARIPLDLAEMDQKVAKQFPWDRRYSREAFAQAIREHSPHAATLSPSERETYARDTVAQAFQDYEKNARELTRAHERDPTRDHER